MNSNPSLLERSYRSPQIIPTPTGRIILGWNSLREIEGGEEAEGEKKTRTKCCHRLSEIYRNQILCYIKETDYKFCCNDIHALYNIPKTAISRHLRIIEKANKIRPLPRKAKKFPLYFIRVLNAFAS